jgi:hypothetical protein
VSTVFQLLHDSRPVPDYRLFDVRLVDVIALDDGGAELVAECQGERRTLAAGVPADDLDHGLIGRIGWLEQVIEWGRPPTLKFIPYGHQSLRRAPELDGPDAYSRASGTAPKTVGWRCGARPNGLRAPAGLVPGIGGSYVDDRS